MHSSLLLSPYLQKKQKGMKTQVISVGINPQRPNTLIRPPCYASQEHYGTAGMRKLKIQVSKFDPPTELRLYVGASIPKDKTTVSQTPLQINTKITLKKFI